MCEKRREGKGDDRVNSRRRGAGDVIKGEEERRETGK